MFRAVLDVNVFVSALLRRGSLPANVLAAWEDGVYDLIVSPALLHELDHVLRRDHIARRIAPAAAPELLALIRTDALLVDDPPPRRHVADDPADDYLVELAIAADSQALVTGDAALLAVRLDAKLARPRILSPRAFLNAIASPS